jgi:hypothetical protein
MSNYCVQRGCDNIFMVYVLLDAFPHLCLANAQEEIHLSLSQ